MLRIVFAATLALGALAIAVAPAEARLRVSAPACSDLDAVRGLCLAGRGRHLAGHALKPARRYIVSSARRASGRASLGIGGLVGPLAAKVAEIRGACSASLVSGVRHTLIAGTRVISLHASGRAADLAGDPACIYARLAGWPGGYSVDYARMRHVHISWDPGGREWGQHFRHGAGRHARRRAARHAARAS